MTNHFGAPLTVVVDARLITSAIELLLPDQCGRMTIPQLQRLIVPWCTGIISLGKCLENLRLWKTSIPLSAQKTHIVQIFIVTQLGYRLEEACHFMTNRFLAAWSSTKGSHSGAFPQQNYQGQLPVPRVYRGYLRNVSWDGQPTWSVVVVIKAASNQFTNGSWTWLKW